jgi:hypothetical protein
VLATAHDRQNRCVEKLNRDKRQLWIIILREEISPSLSVGLAESLFRYTISLSPYAMSASSFEYLKLSGEGVWVTKTLGQLDLDVPSRRPLMPVNWGMNGFKRDQLDQARIVRAAFCANRNRQLVGKPLVSNHS